MKKVAVSYYIPGLINMPWLYLKNQALTAQQTIKTSNRMLNRENLVITKYLIYLQNKSVLESFKHF